MTVSDAVERPRRPPCRLGRRGTSQLRSGRPSSPEAGHPDDPPPSTTADGLSGRTVHSAALTRIDPPERRVAEHGPDAPSRRKRPHPSTATRSGNIVNVTAFELRIDARHLPASRWATHAVRQRHPRRGLAERERLDDVSGRVDPSKSSSRSRPRARLRRRDRDRARRRRTSARDVVRPGSIVRERVRWDRERSTPRDEEAAATRAATAK